MALARSWTDRRDGKVWVLRRGLGVEAGSSLLVFTGGAEQRIVLAEPETELDNFTDKEFEALLDRALKVHVDGYSGRRRRLHTTARVGARKPKRVVGQLTASHHSNPGHRPTSSSPIA